MSNTQWWDQTFSKVFFHGNLTSHRCRDQDSRWGLWELKSLWFHKTDPGPTSCAHLSTSAVRQSKYNKFLFCTSHNTTAKDWLTYHHRPDERNKSLCFLDLVMRVHTRWEESLVRVIIISDSDSRAADWLSDSYHRQDGHQNNIQLHQGGMCVVLHRPCELVSVAVVCHIQVLHDVVVATHLFQSRATWHTSPF